MKTSVPNFALLLESYFTQRLIKQRQASPHTIASYRDTFCLFLRFVQQHLKKLPSQLELADVDAPLIATFLETMEKTRSISARTRNARLVAIRSFFRYLALEVPTHSAQIQRVLAIPSQRQTRPLVTFLTKDELEALLSVPNQTTWSGKRDHVLLLVAVQTGLRLSELTGLQIQNVSLESGAHIRIVGKGRKERVIPLTKQTVAVLKAWKRELPAGEQNSILFPSIRGGRLSADAVQHMVKKHISKATQWCPSLATRHITVHSLRHSLAMSLLHAGIDRAMIALWLGHESVETTQMYLHASLELKEEMLSKTTLVDGKKGRYRPDDQLLAFLKDL
jgi:site-specific recombinase XerD